MIALFPKKAMPLVAALGFFFLLVWVKAFWCSALDFKSGQRHLAQEDYIRAITFFDRSIRWYAPLNPYVNRSAHQLWEIALAAEKNGDIQLALIALRTMRQGFYASQSFYTPETALLRQCEAKIISLTGDGPEKFAQAPPYEHRRNRAPNTFWSFVIELGLMGWIGSVLGFLCFGLTSAPHTGLTSRMGIAWGATLVIFYALWILGMTRA